MSGRTLVITNDFPPRAGGIETYVEQLLARLDPDDVVVHACAQDGAEEHDRTLPYPVVRDPARLLLPTPALARRAAVTARRYGATGVWFPSAAPLALLAPRLRAAGALRSVASTHGHEVWWSRLPVASTALRRIGHVVDVVTFDADAVRRPIAAGLGPAAAARMVLLAPGVDADRFDRAVAGRRAGRAGPHSGHRTTGEGPVVLCVSRLVPRKGQHRLLQAWPAVRAEHPTATLVLAGAGSQLDALRRAAAGLDGVRVLGRVPAEHLPALYAGADLFVLPVADRFGGLVTESLGIVLLEAAAAGLPVVAGRAGGTREAVLDGRTGTLLDGRDVGAVQRAVNELLADPARREDWGRTGRRWVSQAWSWDVGAERLRALLAGEPVPRWG